MDILKILGQFFFFIVGLSIQGFGLNGVFQAGASKIDITPPIGTKIYGNWVQPSAKHIHDPLNAKCLVLDDGVSKIALVVVDVVEINKRIIEVAKDFVVAEIDFDRENILVSATHTHSGPGAMGDEYLPDDAHLNQYSQFLARKIADAIIIANNNKEPAMIAWGGIEVDDYVFVRRWIMKDSVYSPYGTKDIVKMNPGFLNPQSLKPAGVVDPELSFISVKALSGRPISVLANYSLHYVGGVPKDEISADYFSLFGDYLDDLMSEDVLFPRFVGIMSNGTSGNINNLDFSKEAEGHPPYVKMNLVAQDLAAKVFKALQEVEYQSWVPIDARQSMIRLKVNRATPEVMANVAKIQARPDFQKPYYSRYEKMYAQRVFAMEANWPDSIEVLLQAFRIGDLGVTALPFEAFSQMGLELKQKSPFKDCFTIGLANGCLNYLPTPEEIDMGGYETWPTINRVERMTSVKVTEALLELLDDLK
ncbi:neutral/alkaline non-lysosomal ceramidase N-terminal domain-containing protein [Membranihabitans marinus]|uniref:neutral/alkaline non-lysosomal ceramidase N-terminal domain-containing protein n=1 Tax=Membranihabitans marinus TaxID=1227546 RepID=UPI001F41F80C|nr:neutral/alkaline non-lysosomal ceramidase N-terminal domain-containing protein [Membranihabitans marinus]